MWIFFLIIPKVVRKANQVTNKLYDYHNVFQQDLDFLDSMLKISNFINKKYCHKYFSRSFKEAFFKKHFSFEIVVDTKNDITKSKRSSETIQTFFFSKIICWLTYNLRILPVTNFWKIYFDRFVTRGRTEKMGELRTSVFFCNLICTLSLQYNNVEHCHFLKWLMEKLNQVVNFM